MRFKKSVIEALIDEVEDVQSGYGASFEEDGPPTASINAKMLGRWLWVSGRADYEGATWDQSTDRASGDPYSAHVFRDWVGKKKTAPTTVSSYEELHEWSLFHTRYEQEYTDVGSWGVHKDRYIRDVSEKGVVTINAVSNRRFQDVSPSSETVDDTLDLSIFESITFEKLIELLQDPNSLVREVAAKQLGHLQDARAIDPYLIRAVDDESIFVRDYAIGALGALGGQKSIKKLSELILGSKYPPESAIYALSKIGEPSISSISPGLHSENQAVRIGSVSILQNIGGEKAIKLLRNSLKINLNEEYQHTLISIINAFGDVEAAETIDDILPLMTHENPSVQFAVLTALRKMKSEQVVAPLVEGLLTSHHWVRKEIVEVLDEMGWKPSNQEEERWIFFAKEEWEKLISMEDSAIEIILLALKDKDEYHRCKILSPLSKAGIKFSDQRIADAIISIYRNKGQADYLRRGAIEALVSVPTAKTVSFLLREFPKVEDEYSQGKFIDTLKSMILSDTDVSSKVVSYLKRMNPENQSEKEIAGYVELFKIMPLTPKQIQTIRPWVIAIDKKELKEDQEK
ncbi:MAG: HEAT repeat domain-containing protein, partial [Candidatus Thorarchaeota archaeon]